MQESIMHRIIGWQMLLALCIGISKVCSEEEISFYENEIVSQEWHQTVIGNIKYAKITFQNDIIVQNFKNQIMKYDFFGNQKWSQKFKQGELIKVQNDWAIVFNQSTKTLDYIELHTGKVLHEVKYEAFKDELPRMKSSETIFLMHDTQSIFLVKSNRRHQNNMGGSNEKHSSSTEFNEREKEEIERRRYIAGNNYEILNIQIDREERVHVLLQYKKSQICLAMMEIDEENELNLRLRRCRQMSYNQKIISYSSQNGFLIQTIKDIDDASFQIVFFDSAAGEEEDDESTFSMFSSEEDTYRARETIQQLFSFEQNEIVLFKYAHYLEICKFTSHDMICPDIFIKKRQYSFIPTQNYQSLLILSNSHQDVEENQQFDENKSKKQLNAQIFDLEQFQVFNFGSMIFEENISFVYAKVNMNDALSPSINLLVQTTKQQAVFGQMFVKQQITYSLQEGSLQNDLPPVFYRFYNTLSNPYPKTNNNDQIASNLGFNEPALSESMLRVASTLLHNIVYRWQKNIEELVKQFNQVKQEIIDNQPCQIDTTYNDRMYGFEKMILIPTKNFRLFALNSATGQVIYKKSIEGQKDQNEVIGLVRLQQNVKSSNGYYASEYSDSLVMLINNLDHILLQFIAPTTGELLDSQTVYLPDKDRFSSFMKVKLFADQKNEHLIFFTKKLNSVFFPELDLIEKQVVNKQLHSIYVVKHDSSHMLTYQFVDSQSPLQQKYSLPLKANQKLLKIVHHHVSQIDVTELQQRIIPIETDTKDAYRWIDFENRMVALLILNESEKKLSIYVVDSASNTLIFQKYIASVRPNSPIDMYLHENQLYVSFYSDYYHKQTIFQMKIYFRYFLTIFSLPNPELPLSSVTCDVKTLFSEQSISRMHSVVLNNLIFTNHQNDIMFVNLQRLNETEITLTNSSFTQINTHPLSQVQNIYIDKTSLTSRYLLFANGAQIYSVNFTPDSRFDTLPLNFNYKAVINSLAICFTLLLISRCYYSIRLHQSKAFKL